MQFDHFPPEYIVGISQHVGFFSSHYKFDTLEHNNYKVLKKKFQSESIMGHICIVGFIFIILWHLGA